MIYAEMRKEDYGDGSGYTLRYLVWNGDLLGTYGVHFGRTEFDNIGWNVQRRPEDPQCEGFYAYGASRDYHQSATAEQVKAYEEQQRFYKLSDAEQDVYEQENGWPSAQTVMLDGCCYLPDGPSICDGSSLVEVIVGNDERCFAIAAMMANVDKETA